MARTTRQSKKLGKGANMANFITIFRVLLIFGAIFLLYNNNTYAYFAALALIAISFSLDGLDGYIARKFNETSKLGAMLDIMSDRIAENALWVTFAVLGWIPISFPLIALTRGFITDGIRSVAMERGLTAFGEASMQSDKFGYFICSSKFSRIAYAIAKVLAFLLFVLIKTPCIQASLVKPLTAIAHWTAFIAIEFCVVRALPVIFESKKLFKKQPE